MTLRRSARNPILTRGDIPRIEPEIRDPTSVFNPGAIRDGDHYRLMLRVQTRGRETHLVMAEGERADELRVLPEVVRLRGIERVRAPIYHVYDPRLTAIGDRGYAMVALDVEDGCRLGVAVTDDWRRFEFLGLASRGDARNGVLFPETFGGRYLRLERPNQWHAPGEPPGGSEIILSESANLLDWRPVASILRGRPHYWDELIGPGPPPVRTTEGWLCIYHGIALHFASVRIYQAGVFLLDLDDPARLRARGRLNILEPRESYELVGQVPNVVFPSGLIADGASPEAVTYLYYGAADTCVALATATVGELIAACAE